MTIKLDFILNYLKYYLADPSANVSDSYNNLLQQSIRLQDDKGDTLLHLVLTRLKELIIENNPIQNREEIHFLSKLLNHLNIPMIFFVPNNENKTPFQLLVDFPKVPYSNTDIQLYADIFNDPENHILSSPAIVFTNMHQAHSRFAILNAIVINGFEHEYAKCISADKKREFFNFIDYADMSSCLKELGRYDDVLEFERVKKKLENDDVNDIKIPPVPDRIDGKVIQNIQNRTDQSGLNYQSGLFGQWTEFFTTPAPTTAQSHCLETQKQKIIAHILKTFQQDISHLPATQAYDKLANECIELLMFPEPLLSATEPKSLFFPLLRRDPRLDERSATSILKRIPDYDYPIERRVLSLLSALGVEVNNGHYSKNPNNLKPNDVIAQKLGELAQTACMGIYCFKYLEALSPENSNHHLFFMKKNKK